MSGIITLQGLLNSAGGGPPLTGDAVSVAIQTYLPYWHMPLNELTGSVAYDATGTPVGFYAFGCILGQPPLYPGGDPCVEVPHGTDWVGPPASSMPLTYDEFAFIHVTEPLDFSTYSIYATHGDLNSHQHWQFRGNPGAGDIEYVKVEGGVGIYNSPGPHLALGVPAVVGFRVANISGTWTLDIFVNHTKVYSGPIPYQLYTQGVVGVGVGNGYATGFVFGGMKFSNAAFFNYAVPDSLFTDVATAGSF